VILCVVKLKLAHYTHRRLLEERRYSSYSSISALNWVIDQRHAPAALCPLIKNPRYPLYRKLDGPQSRCGHLCRLFRESYLSRPVVLSVRHISTNSSPLVHLIVNITPARHQNRDPLLQCLGDACKPGQYVCKFIT
jgi:hypothetical protein